MSMRKVVHLAILLVLVIFAGCDTRNVGRLQLPSRAPQVSVAVPAAMTGESDSTWTVTWTQGTAPFTIEMDMGGGTTENVPAGTPATSPFTQVFEMVNPSTTNSGTFTYHVTITDAAGLSGTRSAQYTIGTDGWIMVAIESLTFDAVSGILRVEASSNEDAAITIDLSLPDGIQADRVAAVADLLGEDPAFYYDFRFKADFTLWPDGAYRLDGVSGNVDVTASTGTGWTATSSIAVAFPPLALAPDTLYAIPSPASVATGDPVTVIIATGVPAHPFQFLNGVGLTIEGDAEKVPWSFDAGAPGFDEWDADGFWTAMAPVGGFLLPPDSFIVSTAIAGSRERWDFNLTVIGGSDQTTASGALFSYQFTFSLPGVKTFGFQQFEAVNRTYYSDGTSTEYFWGDISNDHPGVPNSVEVVE